MANDVMILWFWFTTAAQLQARNPGDGKNLILVLMRLQQMPNMVLWRSSHHGPGAPCRRWRQPKFNSLCKKKKKKKKERKFKISIWEVDQNRHNWRKRDCIPVQKDGKKNWRIEEEEDDTCMTSKVLEEYFKGSDFGIVVPDWFFCSRAQIPPSILKILPKTQQSTVCFRGEETKKHSLPWRIPITLVKSRMFGTHYWMHPGRCCCCCSGLSLALPSGDAAASRLLGALEVLWVSIVNRL